VAQAVQAGSVRLFGSDETPGLIPDVLVATRSTLERRRPVLQAFVQAWLRAVDWWAAHPGDAARLIGRRVGVPPGRVSLQGVRLMGLADNRRLLGGAGARAAPALAGTVLRYSDFFLTRGTVARPVDPLALLRPELLP
jgi:NitT/TauT family transport system substrate-binding protein